jgi:hypothetical protein
MSELIVSYQFTSPTNEPSGRRIYDNGQVDEYRASKYVKGADGNYKLESVPLDWYSLVKLSETEVKAVQQAVNASGADKMPASIKGDPQKSTARERAEWQIRIGDKLKTITVDDWPAEDAPGRALLELSKKLGEIVTKAINAQ